MTNLLSKIAELISNVFRQRRGGVSPFPREGGPARLLVMRHAEKTGEKTDPHLSPGGSRRAQALATYIPQKFGKPDFLIAAATTGRSRRPRETLEPLASALRLGIMDTLGEQEIDKLLDHLCKQTYAGKSGVIAWRHSDIPSLVTALGAPQGTTPNSWDDTVFNLIIEMTFSAGAAPRVNQIIEPF